MNSLAENIKIARERCKFSQAALANLLPCAPSAIAQYETGTKVPNAITLKRLAEVLKTTPNVLLGVKEHT